MASFDWEQEYDEYSAADPIGPNLGWGHCDLCGMAEIQCACGMVTCHGSDGGKPHLNEPNCPSCGRDLVGVRSIIIASLEKLGMG